MSASSLVSESITVPVKLVINKDITTGRVTIKAQQDTHTKETIIKNKTPTAKCPDPTQWNDRPKNTERILPCQKLTENTQLPQYMTTAAAGLDLFTSEANTIAPRQQSLITTGLALAIPDTAYGRIAPQSGLAAKHGIFVNAGVIDTDYRGEIKVLL